MAALWAMGQATLQPAVGASIATNSTNASLPRAARAPHARHFAPRTGTPLGNVRLPEREMTYICLGRDGRILPIDGERAIVACELALTRP
jgi:hypothetical protein